MSDYIKTLEGEFQKCSNTKTALEQKAYMRNRFEFYGITSTTRREIQQPFLLKENLPKKGELENTVKALWLKPQREFQYFSQELAAKYIKQPEKKDFNLYAYMVIHKSWWDTVDFIASKLMGAYFLAYPELIEEHINQWLQSDNIWLHRSAILFQLKYKEQLDTVLLSAIIHSVSDTKEFVINKAIGWILREYSKTDPTWVIAFVNTTKVNPLSKREAVRLLRGK